jgi:lysine decarboxylase
MNTPLVNALMDYFSQKPLPFHMPGHKGGRTYPQWFAGSMPAVDMTEVPGLDNLQAPEGAIKEAQRLAAEAFQSDACFFLVNGSTSGIHIMMMSAFRPGDKVIIPRNCHKSVWGGLVLSGAVPVYIQPEYDAERCLITHVAPETVMRAVEEHPDAAGMVLTNPDYYGMCPHLKEIRDILDSHGMLMLVDEAHGPHLVFHPGLPPSGSQCGADLWVQSAHKTLPALTQAAYLQARKRSQKSGRSIKYKEYETGMAGKMAETRFGREIDIGRVTQVHHMLQSTSPSYLLMASLDWARGYMEEHGKYALDKLMEHLDWTRKELTALGMDTMKDYKRPEIFAMDPTRLVLDLSGLGLTGYAGEELLRKAGVQVEMSDLRRLVLICTVADMAEDFEKLVEACRSLPSYSSERAHITNNLSISREIPRQMLSPKEAFERTKEYVPLKEAGGRICAGLAGAYPPGIPRFCPGEWIDAAGIEELLEIKAQGGHLFGLVENDLVPVIAE